MKICIKNIPAMVHVVNGAEEIVDASDLWLEKTGYEREEILGKTFLDFLTADSREIAARDLRQPYELHNEFYTVRRKNGDALEVLVSTTPIDYQSDSQCQSCVVLFDVTKSRREESQLRVNELHYRTIVEGMLNGFALCEVICDESGRPYNFRFIEVNQSFEKVTSLAADQVIGKTVLEVLPHIEKFWLETFGEVASNRHPIHFQRFSRELNRHFDVLAFSPAKMKFAVLLTDITEQKQTEIAITHSEDLFRRTFDQSPIGAAMVGLDFQFKKVNKELCRITGYTTDELVGLTFADITHPDDIDLDVQQAHDLTRGLIDQYQMDKRYIRKNGEQIWIRLSVRLIRDRKNQPLFFLPMMEDIQERKMLEERNTILLELLHIIDKDSTLEGMLESLLQFLRSWGNIDAVAVRLKQGNDFPYFKTDGFPQDFVRLEKSLFSSPSKEKDVKEEKQQQFLECMCGYIIRNQVDYSLPFITQKGSFVTNSTTALLAHAIAYEMPERMRKHCNIAGYESVFLLPLRVGSNTVGILQCNDKNTDRFSPYFISMLEYLVDYISVAVVQRLAEERLVAKQIELEEMNSALKVLLRNRDSELLERDKEILTNIRQLVLPSIERLRMGGLSVHQQAQLNILQGNLENILSPFAKKLQTTYPTLTPTLMEIAELIKNGLSNKEIAESRGISVKTVETYRKRIRERLNLQNSKINLQSYLMSMQ